jgi:hypothetical protein
MTGRKKYVFRFVDIGSPQSVAVEKYAESIGSLRQKFQIGIKMHKEMCNGAVE